MAIERLNDTTYSADNLGETRPAIRIGGLGAEKFIPHMSMSFHRNEFNIELRRRNRIVTDERATLLEQRISQKIGSETDEYYIKDGKLKWDIIYDSMPASMDIDFDLIMSDGVEALYQPELTAAEILRGVGRPDEIVGSYAFYCNRSNNEYKTGKLFHKPRSFVTDRGGRTAWCNSNIRNNILRETLPLRFMQNAAYPVRLDPSFGYTSIGASFDFWTNAQAAYAFSTPVSNGTLDSMTLYGQSHDASTTGLGVALYSDDSGPDARLAQEVTTVGTVPVNASPAWTTTNISASIVSGTQYWLAYNNIGGARIDYFYDVGANELEIGGTDSFDNPWTAGGGTQSHRVSIYATYTATGANEAAIYHHYNAMRQ